MKKLLIFPLVLAAFAVNGVAAGPLALTVDQAVGMVLRNSPQLAQAGEAVNAANARAGQAKSRYYPSLNAEAKATHLDPDPLVPFGGEALQLFAQDNYDAHVALNYTLLDFGKRSLGAASAGKNAVLSADNRELLKENLAFQTRQTFYGILFLEQSIAVQDQQIASLNEYLRISQGKVQTGSATDFDVLNTRVRLSESQNEKLGLQNALQKQKLQLCRLLGIDGATELQLQGSFAPAPVAVDEKSLLTAALSRRWEMQMARTGRENAQLQLRAAKAEYAPTLNVYGSYGTKNGYMPDLNEMVDNWAAGAEINLPLFNGFATRNKVKESDANLRSAEQRLRETGDAVRAEVRQSISDLGTSREKLDLTAVHVQLAEKAVSQAKVRYEIGAITNLDLLNTETNLAQANLLRLQALYNYVVSADALRKAAGEPLWQ